MLHNDKVHHISHDIQKNEIYKLSSDGLSPMFEYAKIVEVVKSAPDLETAVSSLVEAVNQAGGTDNITVLALQCAN